MFKFWSEIKKEAQDELRPDFGFRCWDELKIDDKKKIWLYLWKKWFFNLGENNVDTFYSCKECKTEQDRDKTKKLIRIMKVLTTLNEKYKTRTYARSFLDNGSAALKDFYSIYLKNSENVVFELLSLYAKELIIERKNGLQKKKYESNKKFEKRNNEYKWEEFDNFSKDLNDLFDHFGIYVFLTRQGFIPKQEGKIIEDIYQPILKSLSSSEYKDIDQILKKAFKNFRDKDFDKVIQNSINLMHAYLQIKLSGKIGKGNFKTLLKKAKKEKIIPYDGLVISLYDNIESFLAKERKEKTDVHPSDMKPSSEDALFVLNLTMVVLQSFLNFKN
jgi:hypothetical protein